MNVYRIKKITLTAYHSQLYNVHNYVQNIEIKTLPALKIIINFLKM